jgi:predicted Zn-dependent protease
MSPSKTQAESFKALVAGLREALREPEQFTLSYAAESSAFVRFNHAKVRQAGQVQQASIGLKLINEGRHADSHHPGWRPGSRPQRLSEGLQQLRETLPLLPQDPYLLLNYNGWQSNNLQEHPLPDTEQVVAEIAQAAEGLDLVGFYAAGPISRGFRQFLGRLRLASGQQFQLRFQPVPRKRPGGESQLRRARLEQRRLRQTLPAGPRAAGVSRPTVTHPGARQYRAYLAPAALEEIMSMLCWGGFSRSRSPAKAARCRNCTSATTRSVRWCRWTKSQRLVEPGVLRRRLSAQRPAADCRGQGGRAIGGIAQCRRIRPDRQRRQRRRIAQCLNMAAGSCPG